MVCDNSLRAAERSKLYGILDEVMAGTVIEVNPGETGRVPGRDYVILRF